MVFVHQFQTVVFVKVLYKFDLETKKTIIKIPISLTGDYFGQFCETKSCTPNPCQNNHSCVDFGVGFGPKCLCMFTLAKLISKEFIHLFLGTVLFSGQYCEIVL